MLGNMGGNFFFMLRKVVLMLGLLKIIELS